MSRINYPATSGPRNITSEYRFGGKVHKVTHSKHPQNAVIRALRNMSSGHIVATTCEVFDATNGKLLATVVFKRGGSRGNAFVEFIDLKGFKK